MFEAVGLPVSRLIRVKYGNLELPSDLPRGKTRRMSTEETEKWLDSISYKKECPRHRTLVRLRERRVLQLPAPRPLLPKRAESLVSETLLRRSGLVVRCAAAEPEARNNF